MPTSARSSKKTFTRKNTTPAKKKAPVVKKKVESREPDMVRKAREVYGTDAPVHVEEVHEVVAVSTPDEVMKDQELVEDVTPAVMDAVTEELMGAPKKRSFGKILLIVLLLLLLAGGAFGVGKVLQMQAAKRNPTLAAQIEATDLVKKIGAIAELPTGENPTIATVTDINKLKGQSFFARAQDGDKVLIYTNAKKAYLYRPSTGKLVEIGPINIAPTASTSQSTATPSAKTTPTQLKVTVYNGTNTAGLARSSLPALKNAYPDGVFATGDASDKEYPKTIVVDLSGKNAATAQLLAKSVGGTVSKLSASETAPKNADILVILGKDFVAK